MWQTTRDSGSCYFLFPGLRQRNNDQQVFSTLHPCSVMIIPQASPRPRTLYHVGDLYQVEAMESQTGSGKRSLKDPRCEDLFQNRCNSTMLPSQRKYLPRESGTTKRKGRIHSFSSAGSSSRGAWIGANDRKNTLLCI